MRLFLKHFADREGPRAPARRKNEANSEALKHQTAMHEAMDPVCDEAAIDNK